MVLDWKTTILPYSDKRGNRWLADLTLHQTIYGVATYVWYGQYRNEWHTHYLYIYRSKLLAMKLQLSLVATYNNISCRVFSTRTRKLFHKLHNHPVLRRCCDAQSWWIRQGVDRFCDECGEVFHWKGKWVLFNDMMAL